MNHKLLITTFTATGAPLFEAGPGLSKLNPLTEILETLRSGGFFKTVCTNIQISLGTHTRGSGYGKWEDCKYSSGCLGG